MNWRGRPLTSHEVVVNSIAATRTRAGLRVMAELDTGSYPVGNSISHQQLAALPIRPHAHRGIWNYTIEPAHTAGDTLAEHGDRELARSQALAMLADPRLTGMTAEEFSTPARRLAPLQAAQAEQRKYHQRGGPRRQATAGHGRPLLSDAGRVLITVIYLRQVCAQKVLAELLGINPTSIGQAITETRELLHEQRITLTQTTLLFRHPQQLRDWLDHDFRRQHLEESPPYLDGVPPSLGSLVEECLYKSPEARPTSSNILARLARVLGGPPSTGLAKLEEANRQAAIHLGEAARRQSAYRSESERRQALADAAKQGLIRVADALKEALTLAAPSAGVRSGIAPVWTIRLSRAELRLSPPASTGQQPWGTWTAPVFDVMAHARLSLRIPVNRYGYEGRSHSLWYCDAQEADEFHWYETAFMTSALLAVTSSEAPFALDPGEESAKALWAGLAEYQVAWPFVVVSIGDLDEFTGRWAGWFADAVQGHLNRPSTMPERQPQGSWRER